MQRPGRNHKSGGRKELVPSLANAHLTRLKCLKQVAKRDRCKAWLRDCQVHKAQVLKNGGLLLRHIWSQTGRKTSREKASIELHKTGGRKGGDVHRPEKGRKGAESCQDPIYWLQNMRKTDDRNKELSKNQMEVKWPTGLHFRLLGSSSLLSTAKPFWNKAVWLSCSRQGVKTFPEIHGSTAAHYCLTTFSLFFTPPPPTPNNLTQISHFHQQLQVDWAQAVLR